LKRTHELSSTLIIPPALSNANTFDDIYTIKKAYEKYICEAPSKPIGGGYATPKCTGSGCTTLRASRGFTTRRFRGGVITLGFQCGLGGRLPHNSRYRFFFILLFFGILKNAKKVIWVFLFFIFLENVVYSFKNSCFYRNNYFYE
jgi:hypothetical protein